MRIHVDSNAWEQVRVEAVRAPVRAGGGGLRGEAVAVDLPDNRTLFVLLKTEGRAERLASAATLALSGKKPDEVREVDAYVSPVRSLGGWFGGAEAEPERAQWPMMVRFGDIADPKSVRQVDPDTIGVQRIHLETTDDEVTVGIEKRIPWIDHLEDYLADPNNPFSSTLPEDFGGFRS